MLGGIDPLQMVCAYPFLLCRRLIIAVKYGYFNAAEYAALSAPAPEWSFDKTAEKLIARGWSNPKDYPGLVEAELQEANRLNGDELSQVHLGTPTHNTESPKDVVMGILDRAYNLQVPRWHEPLVSVTLCGCKTTPRSCCVFLFCAWLF